MILVTLAALGPSEPSSSEMMVTEISLFLFSLTTNSTTIPSNAGPATLLCAGISTDVTAMLCTRKSFDKKKNKPEGTDDW